MLVFVRNVAGTGKLGRRMFEISTLASGGQSHHSGFLATVLLEAVEWLSRMGFPVGPMLLNYVLLKNRRVAQLVRALP
jgi:hypothetical protein